MIPSTTFEIILKNYNGLVDPIFGKPFVHEKSNGETVPVAFTVGYKFRFDGDWYGSFIEFDEPRILFLNRPLRATKCSARAFGMCQRRSLTMPIHLR